MTEGRKKNEKPFGRFASRSNLDNLLRTAAILAPMHNADAEFDNKGREDDELKGWF